ncbi:MAG: HRDC domain-containing protein [Candidatus Dormibacteraeota bacterium]|nr:HRDC domain-containing protein [Candidatus Dormibacteraeota bacterium]
MARPSPGEYPTLQLTPEGGRVLAEKLDPGVRLPAASGPAPSTNGTGTQALDSELGRRLRAWRTEKARSLGVPAYVVLHDRTLAALSAGRPADRTGLLAVPGMGPAKVEKYGDELLQVLTAPS